MSPNSLLTRFARRHPSWIAVSVVLGFSGALFNGISTALIIPVLLELLGQGSSFKDAPPVIQTLTSLFGNQAGEQRLTLMIGGILLAIILKNAAAYASSLANGHLSRQLTNGIRQEGLMLMLEVDLDFYAKRKIGDLTNQIGGEVNRTAQAIRILIQMFTTVLTILIFLALLISISWQLTLAATAALSLVALVNQFSIMRSKDFGQRLSETSRDYSIALYELLTGIRLVKTVSHEQAEFQRLRQLILQREKAEYQSQANSALIGPVNEVSGIIALLAIVWVGRLVFSNQLNALSAVLLPYLFILFRLMPVVGQLNGARGSFANALPSVEIVADFLQRDNKPLMASGPIPYTQLKEGIRFEEVTFAYPDHEEMALRNVNLSLPRGTTLALVGASGAGKSTLADLLPRFYDPTQGRITIDGIDLRQYDLSALRKAMGVVSQDTFLFNNSVRYNIAYSRENATDDEVFSAAKRANAYDFIMQLPKGFETQIGDRGVLLSGGQRQRIAIARALLKNPEILILDEATSALDTVSERLVQQAIDELSKERTTMVIAHRLSTVQKAHQIAVLDKGRVVEVGTHTELLNKGGYYTRLYSMQFSDKGKPDTPKADHDQAMEVSYEIRTRLNSMIGSLGLLVDGLADSPEECSQLTDEAYHSAVDLLKALESIEDPTKLRAN